MSKDWKKIAKAHGLAIPEMNLERIAQPLGALEAEFRPLARAATPEDEPAVVFRADPEDGA